MCTGGRRHKRPIDYNECAIPNFPFSFFFLLWQARRKKEWGKYISIRTPTSNGLINDHRIPLHNNGPIIDLCGDGNSLPPVKRYARKLFDVFIQTRKWWNDIPLLITPIKMRPRTQEKELYSQTIQYTTHMIVCNFGLCPPGRKTLPKRIKPSTKEIF
jgi:hypothetical protein